MPRRRKLVRHRSKAIKNAVETEFLIQRLETRRLFTTFSAGVGQTSTYEYEAEGGGVMRIAYHDVTFEALGVSVDSTTDAVAVGDLIPAGIAPPAAPLVAFNLFTIYVTQSAADSFITVAPVARLTANPPPGIRADIPFGAGQALLVNPADGLNLQYAVTPGAGIGGGVLGAYTFAVKGVAPADVPITEVPDPGAHGVYPGNAFGDGLLHAGFIVPDNLTTGLPQNFDAFKFAGEVFGNVHVTGNIQLFYAGALLTGDATGVGIPVNPTSASTAPNFEIDGDLHDLITAGDIGGDLGNGPGAGGLPNYDTGFTGYVGGTVGEVYELTGGFFGTMHVAHNPSVVGFTDTTPEQEIEYKNTGVYIIGDPGGIGQIFEGDNGYLTTLLPTQLPAPFTNDSAATAQYLGTSQTVDKFGNVILNPIGQPIYDSEVTGTLQDMPSAQSSSGDNQDWYAVAMLAGQTMTINITGGDQQYIVARVMDPDGRTIASDDRDPTNGVVQIHTDRPGIYRIGLFENGTVPQNINYLMKITGTGNLGMGVLAAAADVSDMGLDGFIQVDNGDFGGIFTAGNILSGTTGPSAALTKGTPVYAASSIIVPHGDLREVVGNDIGAYDAGASDASGTAFILPLVLSVPNGNVGLVDTTGGLPTDMLAVETQFDPNYLTLATPIYKTDDLYAHAIGGNIEVIHASSTFYGLLGTNAGIGTIYAANMATKVPTHIDVNADNQGDDGIIDLIDVPGQFGVLGGGPEFVTNTGGNIRYLNATGTVFLPTAFGGEVDAPVTYPVGSVDTFTDDSGAQFTVTANGPITTVNINNSNGTTTQQSSGSTVTVLSYPVLDKSGLVPISISSTAQSNASAGSLTINGTGVNGSASEVDVANISITGVGRPITTATTNSSTGVVSNTLDAFGNTTIEQAVPTGDPSGVVTGPMTDPTDEFLSITGPARFNVLNVTATVLLPFVTTNSPVEILNATQGEVVDVTAPEGLGTLIVNGNLGFATPQATAAAVMPNAEIADGNTYPFVQQRTGAVFGTGFVISDGTPTSAGTTGNVVSIEVGGAVGNVEAGGTIQSLIANYPQSTGSRNATPIAGQLNGVVGPILASRLLYVDVGQGLLPTGSGLVGESGLYGTGKIGLVTNAGNPNGDIRGNIVSAEDDASEIGIDGITVSSASIIGSTIATIADAPAQTPQFIETSDLSPILVVVKTNEQDAAPNEPSYTYDIGPITVSGDGGIIGSSVLTGSVAGITVTGGGFGIFSTLVDGQNSGRLGSLTASGYGIRDCEVIAFGYIGPIAATGNGGLIPVTAYPIDVRPSDVANTLDPYYGGIDTLDDINATLGTSVNAPNIANRTDTGVIENDVINGLNDVTSVTAQKSRTTLPVVAVGALPTPSVLNVPVLGSTFANSITFGGRIGSVRIAQETDGFQITAGSIGSMSLSSSVNRVGISVAGPISSLIVNGNLGEYVTDPETGMLIPDSYINAGGPNGTIGTLRVMGNMNANVYATASIKNVLVTGDLLGGIIAYGRSNTLALGTLRVFGGIRDGSLILNGNVGSIIINGTLGTSTGSLTIHGNANLISIGANHLVHGAQLALALIVDGTLTNLMVHGSITGSVQTGLDLTHLTVIDDGATPNAISGNIHVDGRLGTANITNGNITSNIVAINNIGSFTITRGDLNAGASIQSQIGSISSFRTIGGLGYGVFGSILGQASNNGRIDISGNLGDGNNTATITAYSASTFLIRGSIAKGANIAVATYLDLLQVNGSILAGATISAHPLKRQKILGTNAGTVTAI